MVLHKASCEIFLKIFSYSFINGHMIQDSGGTLIGSDSMCKQPNW